MVRKTKEEALETRSLLLDTAERVFHKKGVSHTSLADIAEAAGLTRGAIYWHFKNKVDLFNAMMDRVSLPMEDMTATFSDSRHDDPLAYIKASILTVFKNIESSVQTKRVFDIVNHKCEYVDDMESFMQRRSECRESCIAQIQLGIGNSIKRGQIPATVNVTNAAIGLHSLVNGLITSWLIDPKSFSLARDTEQMIECYLAGLGAHAAIHQATPKPKKRLSAVR